MTRSEEGVFRPRADQTAGLSLFEEFPPLPPAHYPGAGQRCREDARTRAQPTSADRRHTLALLIEAHGPLTRQEMADHAGWPKDSVNGRVAEARQLPEGHEDRMVTEGSRDGQSLVHLCRLRGS